MTFCVVVASYTMTSGRPGGRCFPARSCSSASGLATGIFNATLIRVLRLPSIIATLGTLSILAGRVAPACATIPKARSTTTSIDGLTTSVGFVPIAFVVVVVLAVLADVWLYRTRTGLAMRAVGLDETSSRRLGMATGRIGVPRIRPLLRDGVARRLLPRRPGPDRLADHRQLRAREHRCGRARRSSLAGGRGSFVGTLLAALFLSLIDNVLPLFQQPTEYAQITIGVLILLALVLYQGPELLGRLRTSRAGVGRLQTGAGDSSP